MLCCFWSLFSKNVKDRDKHGILPPFVVDFVCCLLLATSTCGRLSPTIRHTLSLELYSKGSNYITQPNNELVIKDGGHLVFDQGLRDRLFAGEGGGRVKHSSLSFPNHPPPPLPSPVEPPPPLLWPNLAPNIVTFTRSPTKRLPVFLILNTRLNNICMKLYILSRSSTVIPRTIIR